MLAIAMLVAGLVAAVAYLSGMEDQCDAYRATQGNLTPNARSSKDVA